MGARVKQEPSSDAEETPGGQVAATSWVPQFQDDGKAWADLIGTVDEFPKRFAGYRSLPDMLLGEIMRYGLLGGDQDRVRELVLLYNKFLSYGPNIAIRRDIYRHVAVFAEDGVIGAIAFLPFVFSDPDRFISATAVIDYASMATPIEGDPMSRVETITAMIAHGDPANRGAAFGGLLYLGDPRVCDLLLPVRDGLTLEEVGEAMGCCTGFPHASSIEFLLGWLEAMEPDRRDGLFAIVAAGLGRVRKAMQEPFVRTGERPFPATGVAPEELRRMSRNISIEEYTEQIAPRLRQLERGEPEPKLMPQVLEIWGVAPSGKQESGVKEFLPGVSKLWGLFSKALAIFAPAQAGPNRTARLHTEARADPMPTPDPDRPTDSEDQGASESWVPQFESDPEAWAQLTVGTGEFSDRVDGYHSQADMLLGEIIRFGVYGDVAVLNPLYGRLIAGGLGVALRRKVYGYVTALQREGTIHPVAFMPFACWDPDLHLSAKAVVDYVSTAVPFGGDPMSRVKEMIGMIADGDIENRGGVFGGLLYLGDPRVCSLLLPLRDGLTREETLDATLCCTGLLHASSVEFLLGWLEEMQGDRRDSFFAPVAAGLGLLRKAMREPLVSTGERAFPITGVTPQEQDRMARKVSIEEYTKTIAARLRALEWIEPVSREDPGLKVMPDVLAFWGVAPLGREETGSWKH
jgi:hypothetical protein